MLDALPIVAFGFQASTGNLPWRLQHMAGSSGRSSLAIHRTHQLAHLSFALLCTTRRSFFPPYVQCHTNLVAVFAELEEEPDLFGSSSSLTALAAASASGNNPNASSGATPPDGSSASLADKAAAGGAQVPGVGGETAAATAAATAAEAPEQRVMLLRNPPRRFVRAVQRTPKLLGMVQVVSAASESEWQGRHCCSWFAVALARGACWAAL
jgi:hypothetical protein